MAKKNTVTFDAILVYPKVFDQQGKDGDIDRGKADSSLAWQRALAKDPVAVVDAYFKTEEDLEKLTSHESWALNPDPEDKVTRVREGDSQYGIGKFVKLKRKLSDVREFPNRKTGEYESVEMGGPVKVKTLVLAEDGTIESHKEYDYEELGAIGNGSEAKVRTQVYGKGSTRLEAIGVYNLVEWIEHEDDGEEF